MGLLIRIIIKQFIKSLEKFFKKCYNFFRKNKDNRKEKIMKNMFMYSTGKYSHFATKSFGKFGYIKHMPSVRDIK